MKHFSNMGYISLLAPGSSWILSHGKLTFQWECCHVCQERMSKCLLSPIRQGQGRVS